jgi:hypothetical protein
MGIRDDGKPITPYERSWAHQEEIKRRMKADNTIAAVLPFLTHEQTLLLKSIINHSPDGQHPMADDASLPFFRYEYVKELIDGSYEKLSPKGKAMSDAIKQWF